MPTLTGFSSRRTFVASAVAAGTFVPWRLFGRETPTERKLHGEVGVTTGSFMPHLSVAVAPGKLRLLDLPRVMRDELDIRVLDLMTRTLASLDHKYLDELRERAENAGCIITNLKINRPDLDMASPDAATRARSLAEYRRMIDAAHRLGCRWVRPLPSSQRPEAKLLILAYRELIDYAGEKGLSLLVENFGWMSDDPLAIPELLDAVGNGIAASPDTGNWTDRAREEGLAKAFPRAATCDFKAFPFAADGSHPRYDLQRCFQIGWDAGFRGPWCLEHFHDSLEGLYAGIGRLRDMLREWMKEQST